MANTSFGLHLAADLIGGTVQGMDVDKLSREKLFEMIEMRRKARNKAISMIMGQLSLPTQDKGDLIGQQPSVGDWEKATELSRKKRERTAGLTGVGFPVYKTVKRLSLIHI